MRKNEGGRGWDMRLRKEAVGSGEDEKEERDDDEKTRKTRDPVAGPGKRDEDARYYKRKGGYKMKGKRKMKSGGGGLRETHTERNERCCHSNHLPQRGEREKDYKRCF